MSDDNKKPQLLLWLAVAGIVLGPLIALLQRKAALDKAFQANLDGAAMGYMWDIQPDYTGMWVGVIIGALGVIGLFIYLARRNEKNAPADQ